MAVAFDASSESHTGTAGSTAVNYSWTHTPTGSPKGVVIFTFTNESNYSAHAVSYGGYSAKRIARAVDTAGEPGECAAWLLSPHSHETISVTTHSGVGASAVINSIAYGNGYWVAVGNSGVIYYATDPTGSWSSATSGTANNLTSVSYGNGYWAACGASGTIRYKATDPTGSWSGATSGTANGLSSIAYGNGYWVSAGGSSTIRYQSTDPTGSWSGATSPTVSGFETAVYDNGYWVAVGSGGGIIYKATDPTGTWTAATSGTANNLYGVAYGDGYWAATGDSTTIRYKATDPTGSWSGATVPATSIGLRAVLYANGLWQSVAEGRGGVYATASPDTWSSFAIPSAPQRRSIASDGTTVIAVGSASGAPMYQLVKRTSPLSLPTGAQTVLVNAIGSNDDYGVAITVTADYGVEATGAVTTSADASGGTVALAGVSVDDGSPGTNSLRFAGVNSGLSDVPTANSGTTNTQSIDFGTRVIAVAREDTAGQGSRSIGWTATADDVAAVYLAIREAIVPWTVGVPIR